MFHITNDNHVEECHSVDCHLQHFDSLQQAKDMSEIRAFLNIQHQPRFVPTKTREEFMELKDGYSDALMALDRILDTIVKDPQKTTADPSFGEIYTRLGRNVQYAVILKRTTSVDQAADAFNAAKQNLDAMVSTFDKFNSFYAGWIQREVEGIGFPNVR